MNTVTKIAALSPVAIAAIGVTQAHYVISHFATIAEIGAAVAVGAAIWTGKSLLGKRKAKAAQEASLEDKVSEALDAFRASQPQALPRPTTVIDYTNAGRQVSRKV